MLWIESFINYIRYERGFSPLTVVSYKNDLIQFRNFLGAEDLDPKEIDLEAVRSWEVSLMDRENLATTVTRKISTLHSFFKYAVKQGELQASPIRGLKLPKKKKPLPLFLKQSEMDSLIDDIDFGDGFRAVRDKLILLMFYSTGVRRAELVGLRDQDIDFSLKAVRVTGKRNKQRIVPIGPELEKSIRNYLSVRKETVGEMNGFFFVRENGEPLYPMLVYRMVTNRLSEVSTLTKRSPHVLRHTFASAMLNNGAELNSVKELLGHSSLASTEVYTHISFEELKKSYKQAHPRANNEKEETL